MLIFLLPASWGLATSSQGEHSRPRPSPALCGLARRSRAQQAAHIVIGRERRGGMALVPPGLTRLCWASMRRWPPPISAARRLSSMRCLTDTGWLHRLRAATRRPLTTMLSLVPAASTRIAAAMFALLARPRPDRLSARVRLA